MSNKTRPAILQLCLSDAWGGLEMSTIKWARLFKENGYPSFVACLKDSTIEAKAKELDIPTLSLTSNRYFSLSTTWNIFQFIRLHKISKVYCHQLKNLWLLTPALWFLRKVELFGFARMFLKNINKKDPLHSLMYGRMKNLLALSTPQMHELQKCLPFPAERYRVVPNGVDIARFCPYWIPQNTSQLKARDRVRSELKVAPDEILVGLIGRVDIQKGHWEFLEAAEQILKDPQLRSKVRFLLVGDQTADQSQFRLKVVEKIIRINHSATAQSSDSASGDPILVLGFRQDVPDILAALDIFVMPSYEENFANVLLEAMACGLACISTNSGGTPEMLDGGKAGLLVEPKSSVALTDAILTFVQDPQMLFKFSRLARQRAESTYDLKLIFEKILAISDLKEVSKPQ